MPAGNVNFLPVYHGRINFAKQTREKLESMQPNRIAIELPVDLQESIVTAIDRLPVLSIVGYMERDMMPRARIVKRHDNEQTADPNPYHVVLHSQYTYIPIHPGDPMIEAIRFARQQDIPVEFIDLAVDDYDPVYHALPDDEAITLVRDPKRFNELILSFMPRSDPGSLDHEREQFMAAHLRELVNRNERVLFISGYAHVNRIKHMLETGETGETSSGIYHDEQQVFNIHPDSVDLALEEIPYFEYLFEAWRSVIKEGLDPATFTSKITLGKFAFFQQEQRDRDATVPARENASDQGGTVHG
ncbi:hypothetical protein GF325_11000, partial [Candidatus Bathyarchaeota archaeon]|nr:hypothetical protein [Candidatus Bathyarchaeota archaeon]